jgi:MYXO-CTERM domain-containing protein
LRARLDLPRKQRSRQRNARSPSLARRLLEIGVPLSPHERKGHMSMSLRKSFCTVAAAAAVLAIATTASAQTCTQDKDCPQGFTCQSTVVNVAEPDCKPGTECVRPDGSATTTVVMSCEPKMCAGDADCGAGMVCYAQTSTACSGGATAPACAPNTPCDAGAPVKMEEMCTTTTRKICAFQWQLPCNADSDCGAGFTCKPNVSGVCSGGGSAGSGGGTGGSAGGGSVPQPPPSDAGAFAPPMCMTTTSYPGYCAPKVTTCTADSDCPANWKCETSPETPVSSGPGTGAPIAPPAPDAGTAPATKTCVSPFAPPTRGGVGEETSDPNTGKGGSAPVDTSPPTPPPASGTATPSKSSGGCSLGAGAGSASLGLVLAAVLGALVARRRRR